MTPSAATKRNELPPPDQVQDLRLEGGEYTDRTVQGGSVARRPVPTEGSSDGGAVLQTYTCIPGTQNQPPRVVGGQLQRSDVGPQAAPQAVLPDAVVLPANGCRGRSPKCA